jgi:hypothetical protein
VSGKFAEEGWCLKRLFALFAGNHELMG